MTRNPTKSSNTRATKVVGIRRRRRYSAQEKQRLVKGSLRPGVTRAAFAHQNGINPTLLGKWRKLYKANVPLAVRVPTNPGAGNEAGSGATSPGSKTSLVEALQQQVRELQRVLGKLALENELLKEAG
jgi:transposase